MRKTPSWSAAKPSAEPRDPPARMRKERDSFSGRLRPKTFFASPGAAFATPPALLERKRGVRRRRGKRKRRQKKAGKGGVFVEGAGSRRRDRRFRGRPKPSAASRSRRRAGAATSRARPRALRGSGEVSRDSFARARGSRTHHTRALRPAADCTARDARTEAPVIILRAPKRTAEVEAAGATAARAWTRARRTATGAFATMGAEMVMAAMRAGPGTDAYERTSEWPRNAVSGRPQSAFFRRRSVLGRRESATFPDSRRPAPRGPFEPGGKRRVANPEKPKNDGSPSIFQKQWIGSAEFFNPKETKPRKGLWLFFLSDDSSGKKIFFNASEVHPLTPTMTARRQL